MNFKQQGLGFYKANIAVSATLEQHALDTIWLSCHKTTPYAISAQLVKVF